MKGAVAAGRRDDDRAVIIGAEDLDFHVDRCDIDQPTRTELPSEKALAIGAQRHLVICPGGNVAEMRRRQVLVRGRLEIEHIERLLRVGNQRIQIARPPKRSDRLAATAAPRPARPLRLAPAADWLQEIAGNGAGWWCEGVSATSCLLCSRTGQQRSTSSRPFAVTMSVRSARELGLDAASDSFDSYQFLVLSIVITLAREPVNQRHGHDVARGEGVEQFEKLAPVAVCIGRLLAVNLLAARATLLLKLARRTPASRC
jgi:hypothetical protein